MIRILNKEGRQVQEIYIPKTHIKTPITVEYYIENNSDGYKYIDWKSHSEHIIVNNPPRFLLQGQKLPFTITFLSQKAQSLNEILEVIEV